MACRPCYSVFHFAVASSIVSRGAEWLNFADYGASTRRARCTARRSGAEARHYATR